MQRCVGYGHVERLWALACRLFCDLCIGTFCFLYNYMCACAHTVSLTFALSMHDTECVPICAPMCTRYVRVVCVYICRIKCVRSRSVSFVITVQLLTSALTCDDKPFLVLWFMLRQDGHKGAIRRDYFTLISFTHLVMIRATLLQAPAAADDRIVTYYSRPVYFSAGTSSRSFTCYLHLPLRQLCYGA